MKASRSLAGLSWISSPGLSGEKEDAGWRGAASMIRTVLQRFPIKYCEKVGRTWSLKALGRTASREGRRERRGRVKFVKGKKNHKTKSHDHFDFPTADLPRSPLISLKSGCTMRKEKTRRPV